jgi:hypothetical protein
MAMSMLRAALLGSLLSCAIATTAAAGSEEYEFRLADTSVQQGQEVVIGVSLIHLPTGKPVTDAVIFARRLDMAPDGMAEMRADLEPVTSAEPGVYRFKTTLGMEGRWQLSLAAKVQGLRETVQSRLTLKASN